VQEIRLHIAAGGDDGPLVNPEEFRTNGCPSVQREACWCIGRHAENIKAKD
jgi:hypothetical protein